MELLEDVKFYNRTGRFATDCIREAVYQHDLFESFLQEGDNRLTPEKVDVLNKINNDDYVRNDYVSFAYELRKNKRKEFLTPYTPQELEDAGVQTFQVKGYEIGFALKPMADGNMDIISVHNNTDIGGVGEALIDSAKRLGGTMLDHFDGFLSDFYSRKGFGETDRYTWNDEYAPQDWNYEKYGRPDVIVRSLNRKK